MPFQIFSNAFAEGGWIPALHSCEGADLSPSLEWSGVPAGARSFSLILEDPDAPAGVWCHWLLYDIGAAIHALPQGSRPGTLGLSGVNDFGKPGYGGPCPPSGTHRYYFKLYALNTELNLPSSTTKQDLLKAMYGHILDEGQLIGRYKKQ